MSFLVGIFGGGKNKVTAPTAASGLQLQSSSQGQPVQLVYGATRVSPNLMWYGDFVATAIQQASPSGGKGGVAGGGGGKGGGSGNTSYTYATAVAMGLCEGPITGVGNCYVNKTIVSLSSLGLSLMAGTSTQTPWGYLTTNHPTEALNYHNIAYVVNSSYQLGNSPQLPNHNFEVFGLYYGTAPNGIDADPSKVLTDLLTNPIYGAGLPATRLGDLSIWQGYCLSNGLWISPSYNMQSAASTLIDDLAAATNSAVVWTNGKLNVVPYGDQNSSAYGYSYTAPSAPLYSLTDDDFQKNQGMSGNSSASGDPVVLIRKRPADTLNNIKIECLDRNNSYNPAVIEQKDQALIDLYGLRAASSRQLHLFCDLTAGKLSAALMLQRQQIRNQYAFTLDQRYIVLDPMDIVAITDAVLGLNQQWVRILEITENDDGTLSFLTEEYLAGSSSAPAYSFQTNNGYNANYNSTAGNANALIIFEPPPQISYSGSTEVDIAISGSALFGGADVYVASDNTTFAFAGRVTGPARCGILSNALTVGSDPDTINTLAVNLAQSFATLLSGSQADADNNHTLCYVGGEFISYETATLTSSYNYNLTYLRRGQFGSSIAAHAAGANFARMDDGIFYYPYDKSKIGTTIYIKVITFNQFNGGEQSLASVSSTAYVIQGPPAPGQVSNFNVTQVGNSVVFTWTDLANDLWLKGYDISYGPVGSLWAAKLMLTEAHRGTEMTNADVPPGAWEFSIRAHDQSDQLGTESIVAYTVSSSNQLVVHAVYEPDWLGSLSNCVLFPSGVVLPENLYPPSHYTDYTLFMTCVPDPVSACSFTGRTIDIGSNANLRVYESQASKLAGGQSGAAASLQFAIDYWLSGLSDPLSYSNWSSSYANFRYLNPRLTYSGITSGNVSYLSDFTIFADVAAATIQSGNLGVLSGGTTLTFPNAYHTAPYVTATAVSATGLYCSVESITASTCIIHVWNGAVETNATVNWQSTGT